jgi:sulfatase maturation enzyme AslB (radical SAM superfamily)
MILRLNYYIEMGIKLNHFLSVFKVFTYFKYWFFKESFKISLEKYTLQLALLWVARRCNLRCDYCAVGTYCTRLVEEKL